MKKRFTSRFPVARGNALQLLARFGRWLETMSAGHTPSQATYGLLVMTPHSSI